METLILSKMFAPVHIIFGFVIENKDTKSTIIKKMTAIKIAEITRVAVALEVILNQAETVIEVNTPKR